MDFLNFIEKNYNDILHKIDAPKITNLNLNNAQTYKDKKLMDLKYALNDAKSKMDPIYENANKKDWNLFQKNTDIYSRLRTIVSKNFGIKNVTNAWLKYWEIYMNFLSIEKSKITAFFNAELPGTSLNAFIHYMESHDYHSDSNSEKRYDWFASSFVPNDVSSDTRSTEHILGDRYGYWKNNKDKWLMFSEKYPNNNGDMTVLQNVLDCENLNVDFYSHDAGMDVEAIAGMKGYSMQEEINSKLHFGCALAGLLSLNKDGTFVAKQYTCFETITWNLIIIYASLFEEFYLYKPATSRPRNSEIYLVGIKYKQLPQSLRNDLIELFKNFDKHKDKSIISFEKHSNEKIIKFANETFKRQIKVLNLTIDNYQKNVNKFISIGVKDEFNEKYFKVRNKLISNWLKKYPIEIL